jgi:alkylation response protein AidB-like acyl-CoA dehydrogenase
MPLDLNRSPEQRQILDAASAMLSARYPLARLRGHDRDELSEIAGFGAFALTLPEAEGGAGFSVVEEALLHVLLGRYVVSTRVLATALATRLAQSLGGRELAERFRNGGDACAAIAEGDSLLLIDSGSGFAVVFGDRSLRLAALDPSQGGETDGLGHGVPLRKLAHADVDILGSANDPDLLATADLLVSAQLLGVGEAARDLTVSYMQVRQQFGRPLGAFQALKHRCADMAIATEMLSAQLDMAAIALRDGRDDAQFQVAALRLLAPQVALDNARGCIQLHGGIGFSDEADAHHLLKQAHILSRLGRGADVLELAAPMASHR